MSVVLRQYDIASRADIVRREIPLFERDPLRFKSAEHLRAVSRKNPRALERGVNIGENAQVAGVSKIGMHTVRALDDDGPRPVSYTHLDVYKRQGWEPSIPSTVM